MQSDLKVQLTLSEEEVNMLIVPEAEQKIHSFPRYMLEKSRKTRSNTVFISVPSVGIRAM